MYSLLLTGALPIERHVEVGIAQVVHVTFVVVKSAKQKTFACEQSNRTDNWRIAAVCVVCVPTPSQAVQVVVVHLVALHNDRR